MATLFWLNPLHEFHLRTASPSVYLFGASPQTSDEV